MWSLNCPVPLIQSIHLLTSQEKYPQHEFSIIMGSDSFQNLPKWKNFELLVKNYPFIIYKRPGFEVKILERNTYYSEGTRLLQLSATEIRNNIKSGKTIRYLVPDKVREEIEQNSYYK
jgi:nicotinate-nucleotide adenylyltransferase